MALSLWDFPNWTIRGLVAMDCHQFYCQIIFVEGTLSGEYMN